MATPPEPPILYLQTPRQLEQVTPFSSKPTSFPYASVEQSGVFYLKLPAMSRSPNQGGMMAKDALLIENLSAECVR